MTALYSLGAAQFINLHSLTLAGGAPEIYRSQAMPIQRPGVDGTGFILEGVKGRPFQMRSVIDVTSGPDAVSIAYQAMVNDSLLIMVHGGVNYFTAYNTKYWALDVISAWRRNSARVGGLNAGAFVVEAIWTLIPVYVDASP